MQHKTITQSVVFKNVIPAQVYAALMNSKQHAKCTGAKATISSKVGGKFTAYDGYIAGKNIELVPDTKIVQLWRASDWPEQHYSTATFLLKQTSSGTRMTFMQTHVPSEFYSDIKRGWIEYYWEPLKQFFAK